MPRKQAQQRRSLLRVGWSVHADLREEPVTGGSNPPALSTPRQDAASGGPDGVIIDQALETNDPGLTKHSQHFDLGDNKRVHKELDLDTSVDKMAYVLSMDELLFTQQALVETAGLVEGFKEILVMRTVPHTTVPPPLHADSIYTSDAARASEEVPASSAAGAAECPACKIEVVYGNCDNTLGGISKRPRPYRRATYVAFVVWRVRGPAGHGYMCTRRQKKAPSVFSSCTFAPRGDERNASVTLSLKMASKGSKHLPFNIVTLKCLFCKDDRWIWKYSMAHHVRTEYAVAVAVRSEDIVIPWLWHFEPSTT
eukprot:jgi/Undpi1/102/HiC_scaffold_1.g00102.m1